MLGILGSIFSGGITGVLGSLFSNVLNFFNQRQKNKHEFALKELDLKARKEDRAFMITEAEMNLKVTVAEVEGAIQTEEARAFTKSQEGYHQTLLFKASFMTKLMNVKGYLKYVTIPIAGFVAMLFGIVDLLKHLMRPGITIVLILMMVWIFKMVHPMVQTIGGMTITEALKIYMFIIEATIYLTVTCVSWWFSDRRIAKFMMRLDDGNRKD